MAWKIDPQNQYVNQWQLATKAWELGVKVRKLIGYHSKELRRLIDKKTGKLRELEDSKYRYEYPLIEYNLDDTDCQLLIASVGLPIPPKSSCFFCPNRKIREIHNLPEELKLRGELIEYVASKGIHHKENTHVKGLGRTFSWRSLQDISPIEATLIEMQQESRMCSCID